MAPGKTCPFCGSAELSVLGPLEKDAIRLVQCQDCMAEAYEDFWDKRPREDALERIIYRLRNGEPDEAQIAKENSEARRERRRKKRMNLLREHIDRVRPKEITKEQEIFENR
jgi:hypothetical protein